MKRRDLAPFGAFLDPVADKLMVAIALLLLVTLHHDSAWFVVAAAVIVGREIVIDFVIVPDDRVGSRCMQIL